MSETILSEILKAGVDEGASDWHIKEGSKVVFRISGSLAETDYEIDHDFMTKAVSQLLSEKLQAEYEERGDVDFAFVEDGVGRFRANLHRQRGLTCMTLRYVQPEVPSREKLQLPESVQGIATAQAGVIFVTGATGSGKSTTMGCMIEHLNHEDSRHIVTIEDPIEYSFNDQECVIEQREVGLDCESFGSALTHVLRQDPDVIVIGEMRDRETFETALAASETGHLVITTLHTRTAYQSLNRVLDMYQQDERESLRRALASNLKAVICQRLLPNVTGDGMVPAVEVMINTPVVADLIDEGKLDKLDQAIEAGEKEGMISFNKSLLGLVNEGLVSEEDALAASDNAEELRMHMRGIFLSSEGGIIDG